MSWFYDALMNPKNKEDVMYAKIHCERKWMDVIKSGHGNPKCVSPKTYLLYNDRSAEKRNQPSIAGR